MTETGRWIVAVIAVIAIVAMVLFARGGMCGAIPKSRRPAAVIESII